MPRGSKAKLAGAPPKRDRHEPRAAPDDKRRVGQRCRWNRRKRLSLLSEKERYHLREELFEVKGSVSARQTPRSTCRVANSRPPVSRSIATRVTTFTFRSQACSERSAGPIEAAESNVSPAQSRSRRNGGRPRRTSPLMINRVPMG